MSHKDRTLDFDLMWRDTTVGNVSIARHGFTPKAPNTAAQFLRGDAVWASMYNTVTITNTGTVNNLAPGLVSGAINVVRCNNGADLTLTGLTATGINDGTIAIFESVNAAGNIYFAHQSGSSSAGNKFTNYITSANTPIARGVAVFFYDATAATWIMASHEQGQPIIFLPVIGGAGGTSGQSYTTQNGRYYVKGQMVTFSGYCLLSGKGTITGGLMFGNLPFTAAASPSFTGVAIGQMNNTVTAVIALNGYIGAGNNYASLIMRNAASTTVTAMATGDIGNTTDLMCAGTFPTS